MREDREPSVICESIEPNPKNLYKDVMSENKGVKVRVDENDTGACEKLKLICEIFPGTTSLYVQYNGSNTVKEEGKFISCKETLKELKVICGENNVLQAED